MKNKLQERALRLVYDDSASFFSELLERDNSFTIHHRNIEKLATEIYKMKHHEASEMSELLSQMNLSYNLLKDIKFCSYNVKKFIMVSRRYHISDQKSEI